MEQLPFYDETTIRHQFDTKCRLALKSELKDYLRYLRYRGKHEVSISDLPESQFNALNWMDDYEEDICHLKACEYDIKIKDVLLAEALCTLSKRKREVILLSYFIGMNDAQIARKLEIVRSTVYEHRTKSLKQIKELMEGVEDDNKK